MSHASRRAIRAGLLLAAAIIALPAPADAQLGGLKKKVAKAVAGATGAETEAAAPAASGNTRSPYNEWVLEMTDEVLDRVEKGLVAESARRREVVAMLEKQPSREEYEQCQARAAMLPEMQKLIEEYMADMEKANGNNDAIMKVAERMDARSKAFYARECGEVLGSDRIQELQKESESIGAGAAGMTDRQYAIVKERIAPFCTAGDQMVRDGAGATVPGDGEDYVYSAAEIEALTPRCDVLGKAIAATL